MDLHHSYATMWRCLLIRCSQALSQVCKPLIPEQFTEKSQEPLIPTWLDKMTASMEAAIFDCQWLSVTRCKTRKHLWLKPFIEAANRSAVPSRISRFLDVHILAVFSLEISLLCGAVQFDAFWFLAGTVTGWWTHLWTVMPHIPLALSTCKFLLSLVISRLTTMLHVVQFAASWFTSAVTSL